MCACVESSMTWIIPDQKKKVQRSHFYFLISTPFFVKAFYNFTLSLCYSFLLAACGSSHLFPALVHKALPKGMKRRSSCKLGLATTHHLLFMPLRQTQQLVLPRSALSRSIVLFTLFGPFISSMSHLPEGGFYLFRRVLFLNVCAMLHCYYIEHFGSTLFSLFVLTR